MTTSKFLNLSQDNTLGGESPSETKAVSEKAIKEYVDNNLLEKQDKLIAGTNIKTINSQSLLGSGNIEIEGATYTEGEGIVISEENEISTNNIVWRQW